MYSIIIITNLEIDTNMPNKMDCENDVLINYVLFKTTLDKYSGIIDALKEYK